MTQIHTRIRVGPDHRISGRAPDAVPPGEHGATLTVPPPPPRRRAARAFSAAALPMIDLGPWPEGIGLHRDDIYRDDRA